MLTENCEEMKMKFDKTILIVEDDYFSYRILKHIIGKTGAKIIWVQNGTEAVNACENNPDINLVFMGENMPVTNGESAMAKIKEIRKELPVVMQTINPDHREKMFEIGCDDFLTKPYNKEIVNNILKKFIGE
jgi:CheY-like chemotaxis protein